MQFFTSDLHFCHENVISYSNRPFTTVDEMNETLISRWNGKISKQDTVYILGDVAFANAAKTAEILDRLQGQKILVYGNHDRNIRKNKTLRDKFVKCEDYLEVKIRIDENEKQNIVLCHYAMITWNRRHRGAWMLHGHSHGTLDYPFQGKILDVGVDCHNYVPISFDEVARIMADKPIGSNDHHEE